LLLISLLSLFKLSSFLEKSNLEILFDNVLEKSFKLRKKNPNKFDGQGFWQPIKKILEPLDAHSAAKWKKLSDVKTKSIEQIFNDPKYEKLPWFFSKQKWDVKNGDAVNNAYFDNLNKIKAWVTKPNLYQRFTKRLSTVLI
jgi:hypothetical protein